MAMGLLFLFLVTGEITSEVVSLDVCRRTVAALEAGEVAQVSLRDGRTIEIGAASCVPVHLAAAVDNDGS